MNPETTLSRNQMENFSINVVDNFEGCAEATVFLKKIYGEEVTNLTSRRKDFTTLSRMGKAPWIINFLLNTITKEYRAKYLAGLVSENLWLLECDFIKLEVINIISRVQTYSKKPTKLLYDDLAHDYEYLHIKREEYKQKIKDIGLFPIITNESKFEALMVQSQFLKALQLFLIEVDGTLTRSVVSFCQQLGEAIQWKFIRSPGVDYNKKTLENCALTLIDYVGYFVVSNEKELNNGY